MQHLRFLNSKYLVSRYLFAAFIAGLFLPISFVSAQDITTGLVGHWKFDEGSGTTAVDSSGNNNTGTLTNGPAWTTGKIGGALSFDGVDDYVSLSSNIDITGDLSASIWFFDKNLDPNARLVGRSDNNEDFISMFNTGFGEYSNGLRCNNSQSSLLAPHYSDNTWHHVTYSRNSSGVVSVYLDNSLLGTLSRSDPCTFNAIGRASNDYMNGLIDEVRIYNRALSSSDIQALYTLGGSPPPPPTGGDTTAPTVTITAPSAGTTVSNIVTMSASAADNIAVTRVEFYVDGVLKSTDTISPYSFSWDTTNGGTHPCTGAHTHTLQSRAFDAANNQGTSTNVVVNMNNPSYCTTPPPLVNPASFTTPYDTIPNFAQNPTIVSTGNGNWSNAATWNPARVPTASDIVLVSHTVTYDSTTGDVDTIGIASGGIFRFSTTQNTSLRVANFLVQPQGTLEVGTQSNPIPANLTAEIVIKNKAINLTTDPNQFGTSLVSLGTVTMHGSVKSPTFVRTSVEPRAGNTTITLEQAVIGWRVGDRIFLPDTRQVDIDNWFNPNYVLQIEERTISAISGNVITLSSPLTYDHRGARDADGTPTVYNGIKFLPHVGNLTRNIVIRSENPSGTRGHTLMSHRADIDIRYVQFQDLGRTRAEPLQATTNHIGRYPLHMHQLWGPINPSNSGYQFELVGNAINDSLKWPIAVHGSHFGLIRQNVIFGGNQLTGAGIAVEDGTETENLFEENFVANIRGNTNPRDSGPSTADGSTPGSGAECFWAAGFNNRFVNNIISDCRNSAQQIVSGPGFKFITTPAPYTSRNPIFRGANMTNTNETKEVIHQNQPILEFRGNEVYGIAASGFTAWQLGTDCCEIRTGIPETIIKDFRVWHTYEAAIWNYPVNHVTIDGLVYRIDPATTFYWQNAVESGDYRNINLTIRGGSIHAGGIMGGTTDPLGTFRLENIDAVTHDSAFIFETPSTPGSGQDRPASGVTMILRNNTIRPWSGQPLRTIEMNHTTSKLNSQPNDVYEVFVYDYQGKIGSNFRVYFQEQATQNFYGSLAPCTDTTTHPEIDGITCPISGGTPPPTTLLGDLNLDGTVNNFDWNIMAGVWFTNDPIADINKDSVVNTADYYFIYTNWGRTI